MVNWITMMGEKKRQEKGERGQVKVCCGRGTQKKSAVSGFAILWIQIEQITFRWVHSGWIGFASSSSWSMKQPSQKLKKRNQKEKEMPMWLCLENRTNKVQWKPIWETWIEDGQTQPVSREMDKANQSGSKKREPSSITWGSEKTMLELVESDASENWAENSNSLREQK